MAVTDVEIEGLEDIGEYEDEEARALRSILSTSTKFEKNAPPRWYKRKDGDIVKLPGDRESQLYYMEKGYTVLSDEAAKAYEALLPEITRQNKAAARALERTGGLDITKMKPDQLRELAARLTAQMGVVAVEAELETIRSQEERKARANAKAV
jgi:hypothetical protein